MNPLCTVAQVKQYQAIKDTNSDSVLQALVAAYTARVSTYCSRQFDSQNYNEVRNGNGQFRMLLRQWPVTTIASITVGTRAIPSSGGSLVNSGYYNVDAADPGDGKLVILNSYQFDRGYGNVNVNYTAGYSPATVTGELWNIPTVTPFTITLANALGYVGGDTVIHTTGGSPFTRVAGNPAVGQYSITAAGVLTFNSADAGVGVTIGYNVLGFPADLTEAVVELVALRYKTRDWTGFKSKSLAGETVSFATDDMPPQIKMALEPHRATMVPQ